MTKYTLTPIIDPNKPVDQSEMWNRVAQLIARALEKRATTTIISFIGSVKIRKVPTTDKWWVTSTFPIDKKKPTVTIAALTDEWELQSRVQGLCDRLCIPIVPFDDCPTFEATVIRALTVCNLLWKPAYDDSDCCGLPNWCTSSSCPYVKSSSK